LTAVVFDGRLGRELRGRSDFPLRFGLGSGLSSSGGDVDKVLVEENVKGYVRHWERLEVCTWGRAQTDEAVVF
jgi:hypothetical protein